MKRTLAPPEHVEHDATAADPWRMAVSAWIVVEEHRWLELDVLMRNAPPVVLRLFDTQYPLIVWKPTSYALPLPRSATNESQLRKLPVLVNERRFSLLILDRAPINEKIQLAVGERRQVQNYLRRRARRIMKARSRVKIARSFALDSTLYTEVKTLTGQGLAISSLEKGKRIFIPLQGEGEISGNIRIVLDRESRKVEAHISSEAEVRVKASEKVVAVDAGLTEVFVDDEGNHYGKELGETLKKASGRLNEKGKRRNKLHALAKKYDRQGKQEKARNIRRRNLGHKKSRELKRRAKITITNQINRAINELIK